LNSRGYLTEKEVRFPEEEITDSGPVPIIECPEEIPCDPCCENCPAGAIEMEGVTALPEVNYDRCTGCGICMEVCPGLAIFMIDASSEEVRLTLPFEFPLPEIGETVTTLNRQGEPVGTTTVKEIKPRQESAGDTPTVTVEVTDTEARQVRNIRRQNGRK